MLNDLACSPSPVPCPVHSRLLALLLMFVATRLIPALSLRTNFLTTYKAICQTNRPNPQACLRLRAADTEPVGKETFSRMKQASISVCGALAEQNATPFASLHGGLPFVLSTPYAQHG